MKNETIYFLYHIPGKKIGVTKNLKERVTNQQGYKKGEYEVLEKSRDIDYISDREYFYQKKLGYKTDFNSFKTIYNQFKKGKKMSINITEQTVTFPVAKKDLKEYLAKNTGFKFIVDSVEIMLDQKVQDWIKKNARVSHFRDSRSYVYNKSLVSFIDELKAESNVKKQNAKPEYYEVGLGKMNIFDKIRAWAGERGIYDSGDTKTQFVKLMEEAGELGRGVLAEDQDEIIDAIGDMVVVLTNLAKLEGYNIEECINSAYKVISDRKGKMVNGTFVKETL
jgi:NTP pyrophosphatase (non-canonical NTP hydrolase)